MTLSPDDVLDDLKRATREQTREWQQTDGVEVDDLRLGAVADVELEVDD